MELLSGAQNPREDKELFFRTLVLFWVLCAIDGHAKNFSLSILPLGRFRMAPLYDVLSAYPILGHGRGQLARQHATMAMAVWGKNRHYHWNNISKRHWLKTAADCGVLEAEGLIETMALQAQLAISTVAGELPEDFPKEISEPVFEGVLQSFQRLH
jgi:serine/threonine-protein kinase HipA